jgi:hypothetical protein
MAIGQGYMPTSQKLRSVAQSETVQLPRIIHMGAREVFLSTPQSSIVRSSKKWINSFQVRAFSDLGLPYFSHKFG